MTEAAVGDDLASTEGDSADLFLLFFIGVVGRRPQQRWSCRRRLRYPWFVGVVEVGAVIMILVGLIEGLGSGSGLGAVGM